MTEALGPDPNTGSTDPMIPEYWKLGEDLQDHVRAAGHESDTVEGIAVDIHDLLQACDRIRDEIIPVALEGSGESLVKSLDALKQEFRHIRWHTLAAESYLEQALAALSGPG